MQVTARAWLCPAVLTLTTACCVTMHPAVIQAQGCQLRGWCLWLLQCRAMAIGCTRIDVVWLLWPCHARLHRCDARVTTSCAAVEDCTRAGHWPPGGVRCCTPPKFPSATGAPLQVLTSGTIRSSAGSCAERLCWPPALANADVCDATSQELASARFRCFRGPEAFDVESLAQGNIRVRRCGTSALRHGALAL